MKTLQELERENEDLRKLVKKLRRQLTLALEAMAEAHTEAQEAQHKLEALWQKKEVAS